jgi:hypothetical protein
LKNYSLGIGTLPGGLFIMTWITDRFRRKGHEEKVKVNKESQLPPPVKTEEAQTEIPGGEDSVVIGERTMKLPPTPDEVNRFFSQANRGTPGSPPVIEDSIIIEELPQEKSNDLCPTIGSPEEENIETLDLSGLTPKSNTGPLSYSEIFAQNRKRPSYSERVELIDDTEVTIRSWTGDDGTIEEYRTSVDSFGNEITMYIPVNMSISD